jgi:hypothetical protein
MSWRWYGLVWSDFGPVECSISHSKKAAWIKAIQQYDEAFDGPFSLAYRGYDKKWTDKKKREWLRKNGADVKPLIIEIDYSRI